MKITKIEVDDIPNKCENCMFKLIDSEADSGYNFYECKLKIMMKYDPYGIKLIPCPLDGKKKEL